MKLIMPPATVKDEIEQWREHKALPESDAFGAMIQGDRTRPAAVADKEAAQAGGATR